MPPPIDTNMRGAARKPYPFSRCDLNGACSSGELRQNVLEIMTGPKSQIRAMIYVKVAAKNVENFVVAMQQSRFTAIKSQIMFIEHWSNESGGRQAGLLFDRMV
ncbi:MAG: hypothetical protein JNM13_06260 [Hyphomicrobiaceae bacterium]|nr:hypothetical protein [Hyphomicrobiaceae bacterium]